jgi:hypothetical protein
MKAYREAKKLGGTVRIGCYLPEEYKELLTKFCKDSNFTIAEAISYLLDMHYRNEHDTGAGGDDI